MTTTLAYIPSPAQGVWNLGPLPIRAYALCIIVGIIVALVIGDRRWAARGGERGVIYDIALWAVPFGLVGGRLYHVMTDWRTYFGPDGAGLAAALRIWEGGLGIWGAVALGGFGAWIACRRRGIPLPAFGDAIAPGIVLAQGIGRLGNYFNQELYGRPTTVPWGLEIYERRNAAGAIDPLNGTSTGELLAVVHPTFLYELLWNVLLFFVLLWAGRRFRLGHGRLFALYVAGYCVGRFWVELLRSDFATEIAGIRINAFTATFIFIGAVVYIMVAPRGREDPATLGGDAAKSADGETAELAAVASASGIGAVAQAGGDTDSPPGSEAALEAEALAADVAEVSDAELIEAEEFAEAKAEAEADEAEPVGGVGAVEGEDVVEAEEAAEEVHEAAAADAEEAEATAGQLSADVEDEAQDEAEEPAVVSDADAESAVEAQELAVAAEQLSADVEATAEAEDAAIADAAESEAVAEVEPPAGESPADDALPKDVPAETTKARRRWWRRRR